MTTETPAAPVTHYINAYPDEYERVLNGTQWFLVTRRAQAGW